MSEVPASIAAGATVESLVGTSVVLDTSSPYVFLGRLQEVTPTFAVLQDADAHDLRETHTTREAYVLDAVRHGINVNRAEVWVRWDEVVCLSRLSDIVV